MTRNDFDAPVPMATGNVADYLPPALCINGPEGCQGSVEYRMPLSGTGVSFPRCDSHWSERLDVQEGINRRYPSTAPADFDPYYAGESWDEDY